MNDTDAAREEARAWKRRTYAALERLRQVAAVHAEMAALLGEVEQAKRDAWDEGFRARLVALTTDPPKQKTNPYRATEKEV